MTTMTKKTNSHIENLYKSLSIQFSLDGFSFCIQNKNNTEENHFEEISFDKRVENPELLAEKLETLFKNNKQLQEDFHKVEAIHNSSLSTLVPNEYFNEDSLKSYLDFNIKTLKSDFIAFDELKKIPAKNVYVPYVNLNNFLFQHFGSFEYRHHSTILIDKLLSYSNNKDFSFFVLVGNQQLEITVIKNNNLIYYNSFEFNTKEDFIYYILFTAEQLKLNPDKFELSFLGDITKDSELYNIAYQYIRNIEFSDIKNSNNYSKLLLT